MSETPQPQAEQPNEQTFAEPQRGGWRPGPLGIAGLVAAVVVVGVVVLVSQLPDAEAPSDNVRAAVDKAGKLYERAQKLMANVVFMDANTGAVAPLTKNLIQQPEQVKFVLDVPNPRALEDLNKACEILRRSLQENPEAAPDPKALAHKLLCRVLVLKGHYCAAQALVERAAARRSLQSAQRAVDVIRTQAAFIAHYDRLTAMSNEDVQAVLAKAQAKAQEVGSRYRGVSQELLDLSKQVPRLRADRDGLAVKARDARDRSRRATGQEGVDLLEQALEYERQMYVLSGKISQLRDRILLLKAERAELDVRLRAREEEIEAAQAMLQNRQGQTSQRLAEREQCRALLAESERSAGQLMEKILRSTTEADAIEKRAFEAYAEADKALDAARALAPERYADAGAEKADTAVAGANIAVERLALQEQLARFAVSVGQLWPKLSPPREAPAAVSRLSDYVPDPAKLRAETTERYRNVIKLYGAALRSAERIHKWVYQGRLAACHLGLYRLSGDVGELDEADRFIEQALEGKRSSPYLQAVVRLERQLQAARGGPATAPATGPATAPASGPTTTGPVGGP